MKVERSKAVALLVELGFIDAKSWEDKMIQRRISQVPKNVRVEDVPEGFHEFYRYLCMHPGEEIELISELRWEMEKELALQGKARTLFPFKLEGKEPADPKPVKSEKAKEPAKEVLSAGSVLHPAVTKAPTPKAKKKNPKAVPEGVDDYGSRLGTISAKVNAVFPEVWEDEALIVKKAGVKIRQARARLYHAQQDGILECRRFVQYRLVKKEGR